jgi:hypothetical protein
MCQLDKNNLFEDRWRSFLSKHERKNLQQILNHREIRDAIDDLLDIRPLFAGLNLGSTHKILTTGCIEVS